MSVKWHAPRSQDRTEPAVLFLLLRRGRRFRQFRGHPGKPTANSLQNAPAATDRRQVSSMSGAAVFRTMPVAPASTNRAASTCANSVPQTTTAVGRPEARNVDTHSRTAWTPKASSRITTVRDAWRKGLPLAAGLWRKEQSSRSGDALSVLQTERAVIGSLCISPASVPSGSGRAYEQTTRETPRSVVRRPVAPYLRPTFLTMIDRVQTIDQTWETTRPNVFPADSQRDIRSPTPTGSFRPQCFASSAGPGMHLPSQRCLGYSSTKQNRSHRSA